MAREIKLSYVLTTYNKLPYLKVSLPNLIKACREDEEIVVMDGGSTDGTAEYLKGMFDQGQIHQFVSERDYGEAHGYNKGFLNAKGELIKIISDDDAFYFEGIDACKNFMLANKDIQVLGADGFAVNNYLQNNQFLKRNSISKFNEWKEKKKPFIFCGLSQMFRRDALPLIGLVSTSFIITDFENTLRVTASKAKLAWYTGLVYVNIVNDGSNSGNHWKRMEIEKEKLEQFYFNKRSLISYQQKDRIKEIFRPIKYRFFPKTISNPVPYEDIYKQSMQLLEKENHLIRHEFLY